MSTWQVGCQRRQEGCGRFHARERGQTASLHQVGVALASFGVGGARSMTRSCKVHSNIVYSIHSVWCLVPRNWNSIIKMDQVFLSLCAWVELSFSKSPTLEIPIQNSFQLESLDFSVWAVCPYHVRTWSRAAAIDRIKKVRGLKQFHGNSAAMMQVDARHHTLQSNAVKERSCMGLVNLGYISPQHLGSQLVGPVISRVHEV